MARVLRVATVPTFFSSLVARPAPQEIWRKTSLVAYPHPSLRETQRCRIDWPAALVPWGMHICESRLLKSKPTRDVLVHGLINVMGALLFVGAIWSSCLVLDN